MYTSTQIRRALSVHCWAFVLPEPLAPPPPRACPWCPWVGGWVQCLGAEATSAPHPGHGLVATVTYTVGWVGGWVRAPPPPPQSVYLKSTSNFGPL